MYLSGLKLFRLGCLLVSDLRVISVCIQKSTRIVLLRIEMFPFLQIYYKTSTTLIVSQKVQFSIKSNFFSVSRINCFLQDVIEYRSE